MGSVQKRRRGKSMTVVFITSLAVYYMFMGICAIVINITDITSYNTVGYIFVMALSIAMIGIWLLVFYSASNCLYKFLGLALALWTLFILTWTYIVVLNFKDNTGYYCVNRRCPNTFWVVGKESNKLPIESMVDYYDHVSHRRPESYDFDSTDSAPHAAGIKSQSSSWIVVKFTKYLLKIVSFIILLGFFVKSWMYLKDAVNDIRIRVLCPQCNNCNTSSPVMCCCV